MSMLSCPKCGTPCLDSHRYCAACGGDLADVEARDEEAGLIGMTISGQFVLQKLIGSGGMGKVYAADQKGVGRTVAVKIMHRHLLGDETAAARFTNEARASSSLNHPHSIAVLDFGQTEVGMLYIVMEHLRGRSLDTVLRREFPMSFGRVSNILCQALEAVEAAHEQNIIHRDLKPENIFLLEQQSSEDFVKVLDFGIAKMLDLEDRSVTTPGLVPGTPEYMSPEQARGEQLDPRSDVYSLGVILYEMLTGSVPFRGSSAVATMMSHVQDPVEPPSHRRPESTIPPSLEAIVLWALAKDPSDRISSAAQFYDVLSAWAQVAGVWTRPAAAIAAKRASSPDVLLDFFSEDQLSKIPSQIGAEHRPSPSSPDEKAVIAPVIGMVGRRAELTRLEQFIGRRGPRTMRIEAEVGMGKSRLVDECLTIAKREGFDVCRCSPGPGWAPPLLHVAHHVARYCLGVAAHDYDAESILQAVDGLGIDAEEVPGIKDLFGLPTYLSELDPASRLRERISAWCQLIVKSAENRRLLLVFEQLERYDGPSRDLVVALASKPLGDLAVLVTQTPEARQLFATEVETLQLPPLTREERLTMAGQMFGVAGDDERVQRVGDAAQGGPLFVSQLCYAIAHEGMSDPPERLADLVAARVARQPERHLLQWLAVFNDAATPLTLSRISDHKATRAQLDKLVEQGFLTRPQEGNRKAYAFVHHLVAMVVYSSIPSEVRREMHQAVADYLRQRDAAVTTTAYHAYQADDGPKAIEELDQAGLWSTRSLDPQGAVGHYTQALELVRREWGRGRVDADELDRIAVDLALNLAAVLKDDDGLAARGVLEEVLSVAAGQDLARARLRLELGRIDLASGNFQRAARHLKLARTDAASGGSSFLAGEITRELARAHGLMNERGEAGKLLLESLELSTADGGGRRRGPSWETLLAAATTAAQVGFPGRARGYLLDALQQAENERSPLGKLRIVAKMAAVHQSCSEWSEAEMRITQGLDLVGQIGDRTHRAELLVALGRLRRIGGDVEGARRHLDEAVKVCRRIGWWQGVKKAEQEVEMLRYAVPQAL